MYMLIWEPPNHQYIVYWTRRTVQVSISHCRVLRPRRLACTHVTATHLILGAGQSTRVPSGQVNRHNVNSCYFYRCIYPWQYRMCKLVVGHDCPGTVPKFYVHTYLGACPNSSMHCLLNQENSLSLQIPSLHIIFFMMCVAVTSCRCIYPWRSLVVVPLVAVAVVTKVLHWSVVIEAACNSTIWDVQDKQDAHSL